MRFVLDRAGSIRDHGANRPHAADIPRRSLLRNSLLGMGSLLLGGGYLALRHISNDSASMVLQVGWLPGVQQIGEIVAKRLGFYLQEGIEFRISGGGPSIDGVSVVASGSAQVGQISSSPSIMLAVSQNLPIRCFAAALQKHPYTYFSLKSNPVRSIGDIVGKRVGVPSTAQVLLKAMLARASLPESSVHIIPVGADLTPLLTGQVDVISGWSTDTTALRVLGADRVAFKLMGRRRASLCSAVLRRCEYPREELRFDRPVLSSNGTRLGVRARSHG